jgi:diguanylate cyclase (GGDEF)-like protein
MKMTERLARRTQLACRCTVRAGGSRRSVVRPARDVSQPMAASSYDPSTDLPTMLGWLAMLITAGALVALSVEVLPYWPIAHKGWDLGIGALLGPLGVVLWLGRRHAPRWSMHAGLLLGVCGISGAVWAVGPSPQTQAPALFYVFLSTFAGAFLPRRIAIGYLGLAGAQYLAVLALHWRAEMATQWVLTMLAVTVPCAVISTLVARLRVLALLDPLTGLANRRLLDDLLPARLTAARRNNQPISVAALDLDGLKVVNDLAGHAAGDQLLKAAAQRWSRALRTGDVMARTGGDEFILLLPDADLAAAEAAVQRLRAAAPRVAFSAGLACWTGDDPADLLRRADAALYAAKQAGGAQTVSDNAGATRPMTAHPPQTASR